MTIASSTASSSVRRRHAGGSRATNPVKRMCSPRRRAMAAPSIASHRNTAPANSSDQTIGARNA